MTIRIHTSHLKQELLNPSVLIGGVLIALLYLIFSTLIINYHLIIEVITGAYSLQSKLSIILGLTKGVKLLYNPFELSIVLLLGFLMGINFILIFKSLKDASKVKRNRKEQKGAWSLGLGMLGFLATSGCASCGITLLSVLGPTVSLSLLPFQALALQFMSLVMLLVSLVYTINRRNTACVIVKN